MGMAKVRLSCVLDGGREGAVVRVWVLPVSGVWVMRANFVPLEHREFVDGVDRLGVMERIVKDGLGGCMMAGRVPAGLMSAEYVDRVAELWDACVAM